MLQKKYEVVKSILLKHIDSIEKDGRLPNRVPASDIGSADAVISSSAARA
jgi:hypothetical protein